MPPIPSTLDEDIKAQLEALERRQRDLKDFQIPRLRSFDGPLPTQQQYAAELREDIDTFARHVESLEIAVDDQKGDRNRRELRRIVEEYREILVGFRKESRAALLASKRAIDAKRTSNRDELFRSNAVREKQDLNEKVVEDAVMTASNNLTEALQRTMTLMQGELEKSVLSTQLLDQSTASLRSASTTHDVLDGLLTTSKHLITALEKSDWTDRVIIIFALVFFVLVVLFILKQRLVDRSIRLAFWWTRFLPGIGSTSSTASDKVVDALDKGSLTSVATEVVSTVLVTASASVIPVVSSLTASTLAEESTLPPEPTPIDILSSLEESLLTPSTEHVSLLEETLSPGPSEPLLAETSLETPSTLAEESIPSPEPTPSDIPSSLEERILAPSTDHSSLPEETFSPEPAEPLPAETFPETRETVTDIHETPSPTSLHDEL